jgi:hypothetical protein
VRPSVFVHRGVRVVQRDGTGWSEDASTTLFTVGRRRPWRPCDDFGANNGDNGIYPTTEVTRAIRTLAAQCAIRAGWSSGSPDRGTNRP